MPLIGYPSHEFFSEQKTRYIRLRPLSVDAAHFDGDASRGLGFGLCPWACLTNVSHVGFVTGCDNCLSNIGLPVYYRRQYPA